VCASIDVLGVDGNAVITHLFVTCFAESMVERSHCNEDGQARSRKGSDAGGRISRISLLQGVLRTLHEANDSDQLSTRHKWYCMWTEDKQSDVMVHTTWVKRNGWIRVG
jgi:hypothetical protein